MGRLIKCLVVVFVALMFFIQDGYALWGRKKTEGAAPKAKQQQTDAVEKKEAEKESAKEIKKDTKQEVKEEVKKIPAKADSPKDVTADDKQKKIEEDKKLRQKKREQLNNTQWEIEIKAIGTDAKEQVDMLVFEDNRFYSDRSSKEGFNATNYTISIKDDQTVVWETMQTAEEGRINFWRGEISDDLKSMRGIASKKLPDGTSVNYSFSSKGKKAIK